MSYATLFCLFSYTLENYLDIFFHRGATANAGSCNAGDKVLLNAASPSLSTWCERGVRLSLPQARNQLTDAPPMQDEKRQCCLGYICPRGSHSQSSG